MFFVFIYELKQKSDFFLTKYDILKILVDFYVRLSQFFYPDLRFLKWIRIRPNVVDPGGSESATLQIRTQW